MLLFFLVLAAAFLCPLILLIQTTAQSEGRRGSPLTRHLLNAAEGAQVAGGGGLLQELQTEGDTTVKERRGEGHVPPKLHQIHPVSVTVYSWWLLSLNGLEVPRVGAVNP